MIHFFELHPFFVVEESFWPLFLSLSSFNILFSFVGLISKKCSSEVFFFNLFLGIFTLFLWGKDVDLEGKMGAHTKEMETSLKWSMGWFISSEVLFFFSFFWGFFNFSISSSIEMGEEWPPLMVHPLDAFSIPLLNTMILLSSGISLTWGHHSLILGNWKESVQGFMITISLGIYFTLLQGGEYLESTFSFNDSLWGSIFYLATGFHGLHVIIGTSLLLMCFSGFFFQSHMSNHHMGVEASSWYWHFVDVVWLFLFISIYWWGS